MNSEQKEFALRGYHGKGDHTLEEKKAFAMKERGRTGTQHVRRASSKLTEKEKFVASFTGKTFGKARKPWLAPAPSSSHTPVVPKQAPRLIALQTVRSVSEDYLAKARRLWEVSRLLPDDFMEELDNAMTSQLPPKIPLLFTVRALPETTFNRAWLEAMRLELVKAGVEENPGPKTRQRLRQLQIQRKKDDTDQEKVVTQFLVQQRGVKPEAAPGLARDIIEMKIDKVAMNTAGRDRLVAIAGLLADPVPLPDSRLPDDAEGSSDQPPASKVETKPPPPSNPSKPAPAPAVPGAPAPAPKPAPAPAAPGAPVPEAKKMPTKVKHFLAGEPQDAPKLRSGHELEVVVVTESGAPAPCPAPPPRPGQPRPPEPETTSPLPPHPLKRVIDGIIPPKGGLVRPPPNAPLRTVYKGQTIDEATAPRRAAFHRDGWSPDDQTLTLATGLVSNTYDFNADDYATYAGSHDMRLNTLHNIKKDTAPLVIKRNQLRLYEYGNFIPNVTLPWVVWWIAYTCLPHVLAAGIMIVIWRALTGRQVYHVSRYTSWYLNNASKVVSWLKLRLYSRPVNVDTIVLVYYMVYNLIHFLWDLVPSNSTQFSDPHFYMLLGRLSPYMLFALLQVPRLYYQYAYGIWCVIHSLSAIYCSFDDYYRENVSLRVLFIWFVLAASAAHRFFTPARVVVSTTTSWYSPHLLSTLLFETGADPDTFKLRSRCVLQRAIAPLLLPQTLAMQVSLGTMQMAEIVMANLSLFRLRGPGTGGAADLV